jgi:hypothetical protein
VSVAGADAAEVVVPVGQAVFASADETVLVLAGTGEAFVAQPGTPSARR